MKEEGRFRPSFFHFAGLVCKVASRALGDPATRFAFVAGRRGTALLLDAGLDVGSLRLRPRVSGAASRRLRRLKVFCFAKTFRKNCTAILSFRSLFGELFEPIPFKANPPKRHIAREAHRRPAGDIFAHSRAKTLN